MKSLRFQATLGWLSTLQKCMDYHEALVNNRVILKLLAKNAVPLDAYFEGNPRLGFMDPCLLQARTIRGFCHLYDGQEAVAAGVQSALNVMVSLVVVFQLRSSKPSDCHSWSMVLL